MKAGNILLQMKRFGHGQLKWNFRKTTINDLPDNLNSWKCKTCDRALFCKDGYVNHVKSHVVSQAHVIRVPDCLLGLGVTPVYYAIRSANQHQE